MSAVGRGAETASEVAGASRERACEHAVELHDCGLYQDCAVLPVMLEETDWLAEMAPFTDCLTPPVSLNRDCYNVSSTCYTNISIFLGEITK